MSKSIQVGRVGEINVLTATKRGRWLAQCFNFWLLRLPTWTVNFLDRVDLPLIFQRLNFLHTAHFAKIDRFPDFGQPRETGELRWMVFCGNFNQGWDRYFEAFVDMLAGGVRTAWGASLDYPKFPAVGTRNQLLTWLDKRLVPTDHYYCAYPNASAHDIRAAIRVNRELRSFVADHDPTKTSAAVLEAGLMQLTSSFQHCLAPRAERDGPVWEEEPTDFAPTPRGCSGMSGFVALLPIKQNGEADMRRAVTELGSLCQSPFRHIGGTHFARLAVLGPEAFVYPDRKITLRSAWLLLSVDFDGQFDESEFSARRIKESEFRKYAGRLGACQALKPVWKHCFGYSENRTDFEGWLWTGVVKRFLMYRDYPDRTLTEATDALRTLDQLQKLLVERPVKATGVTDFLLALRDGP